MIKNCLGCIWIYGAKQYVHFEEGMFERHFCDTATYWIAFISVTLHIASVAIFVVVFIIILALGIWKETDSANNNVRT